MAVIITLDEILADKLQARAAAINLTVEEFARNVLREVTRDDPDDRWRELNQRRSALIRKRFDEGLTSDEEMELEQLQEMADRRLDELDDRMLSDVEQLRIKADQAVTGAG